MVIVMLVVVGLLARKKAPLRGANMPSLALAGGSYGAFFSIVLDNVLHYGHPSSLPDFVLLGGLILGFQLAIAAGAVFMWQRACVG